VGTVHPLAAWLGRRAASRVRRVTQTTDRREEVITIDRWIGPEIHLHFQQFQATAFGIVQDFDFN
jgi:hypothetical protein